MTDVAIVSTFSGYGGLDLAVQALFGGTTAYHSEIEPGPSKVLAHHWPDAPNLGDITAVDWLAVREALVAVFVIMTGGFPCQDVSHAGRRRGLAPGSRSGLWAAMAEGIQQLRPDLVVIENVRGLLSADGHGDVEPCPWCVGDEPNEPPMRALGTVLADLAELGYDAAWCGVRASDVGGCHPRFRVFVIAWPAVTTDTIGHGFHSGNISGSARASGEQRGDVAGRVGRAAYLPTPTTRDVKGHNQRNDASCLTGALLPTPTTQDARNNGAPSQYERNTLPLNALAPLFQPERLNPPPVPLVDALLPTPNTGESPNGHGRRGGRRGNGSQSGASLDALAADEIVWGIYAPAIHRWAERMGRRAPEPTTLAPRGGRRLSPRFVEWMMGLPDGWVTDPVIGLTRDEQLKALGNGVVPQQAAAGVEWLLRYVPPAAFARLTREDTP